MDSPRPTAHAPSTPAAPVTPTSAAPAPPAAETYRDPAPRVAHPTAPRPDPAPDPPEAEGPDTRGTVLHLIVAEGPITAADLADRLALTPAGIRRHLGALEEAGQIVVHDVPRPVRGRGRPARHYVAAAPAHDHLSSACSQVAVEAMAHLRRVGGEQAVAAFARDRAADLERRHGPAVRAAGTSVGERAAALARSLSADGYAATSRPVPGTRAIQLCQGHCPVRAIAAEFPELCEAETLAFSRLLGVHVQRLATLAAGEHVCTTHVPPTPPLGRRRVEGRP